MKCWVAVWQSSGPPSGPSQLSIEIVRLLSSSSALSRFLNAVSSSRCITGHSWPLTRIAQQLTNASKTRWLNRELPSQDRSPARGEQQRGGGASTDGKPTFAMTHQGGGVAPDTGRSRDCNRVS